MLPKFSQSPCSLSLHTFSTIWMCHSISIHQSGPGGCPYILAIIKSAVMDIGVHVFVGELAGSCDTPCFFLRDHHAVSHSACTIFFISSNVWGLSVSSLSVLFEIQNNYVTGVPSSPQTDFLPSNFKSSILDTFCFPSLWFLASCSPHCCISQCFWVTLPQWLMTGANDLSWTFWPSVYLRREMFLAQF